MNLEEKIIQVLCEKTRWAKEAERVATESGEGVGRKGKQAGTAEFRTGTPKDPKAAAKRMSSKASQRAEAPSVNLRSYAASRGKGAGREAAEEHEKFEKRIARGVNKEGDWDKLSSGAKAVAGPRWVRTGQAPLQGAGEFRRRNYRTLKHKVGGAGGGSKYKRQPGYPADKLENPVKKSDFGTQYTSSRVSRKPLYQLQSRIKKNRESK
jgi:hypothetical protein